MSEPAFFTDEDTYAAVAVALRKAGLDAVSTRCCAVGAMPLLAAEWEVQSVLVCRRTTDHAPFLSMFIGLLPDF